VEGCFGIASKGKLAAEVADPSSLLPHTWWRVGLIAHDNRKEIE